MKVKVIQKCILAVNPGSIVEVDEKQFEVARRFLAPLDKDVKVAEIETATRKRKKKTEE